MGTCSSVYIRVWWPEVSIACLPQCLSTLVLQTVSLSKCRAHLQGRWASQDIPGIHLLPLPHHWDYRCILPHRDAVCGAENMSGVLTLAQQALHQLCSLLPACILFPCHLLIGHSTGFHKDIFIKEYKVL